MRNAASDLSTAQLRELMVECAALERDGFIGDGCLRKFHNEHDHYVSINTTIQAVYREAALRWAKENE